MFGIIADLLTIALTVLFPVFASYKALRTSDPAQLAPWLMYWVVLSLLMVVENFFDFILAWVPFYSWFRLGLHLFLMMPGQQGGATHIYSEFVHPFITDHESEIDRFISEAHEKARAAGLKYLKQAIEWFRVNVMGMPPTPPSPPPSRQSAASYTQSLLSRFAMPSARTPGVGAAGDFYNLVSQALSSATSLYPTRDAQAENLTASGTLIPTDLPADQRTSYVNTQRERLRLLLQAFDREAYTLASEPPHDDRLAKSRSEADFDRIEVSEADRYSGGSPPAPGAPGPQGGWMPWNWAAKTATMPPVPPLVDDYNDERRPWRDERGAPPDRIVEPEGRYERDEHYDREHSRTASRDHSRDRHGDKHGRRRRDRHSDRHSDRHDDRRHGDSTSFDLAY